MGNINLIKNDIFNKKYDTRFSSLYSDVNLARERYISLLDGFEKLYGDKDVRIFSAPGRTEIGGNHTDHQHGCVIAAAVELDAVAVVSRNDENFVKITSKGYGQDIVGLNDLSPNQNEFGKSKSLIKGVLSAFLNKGCKIGGFDAYIDSNVLRGSGLSSSAAFEVLLATVINGLFNDFCQSDISIAQIAQYTENVYFGKPCGLMDQMASSVGGMVYIDFNNPKNPIVQKIDFDLLSQGYTLAVVDAGGSHADLTDDYADIPKEMNNAAAVFGKTYLRDVDKNKFFSRLNEIREKAGDRAVLRAIHFFNENERAQKQRDALLNGDFSEFLILVNRSGDSSYKLLQNVYSPKIPNEQSLPLALAVSESVLKGRGAVRVHGGGFAGTVQAYIPNELLAEYKSLISSLFGENSCHFLKIRSFGGIEVKP